MLIPVCHISNYGIITGSVWFNSSNCQFNDGSTADVALPVQEYLNCTVSNPNRICTVVGKSISRGTFFVCFGDNMVYEIDKSLLLCYNVSNAKLSRDRKVLLDGDINKVDLSNMFSSAIHFISEFKLSQKSSLGIARKFFASYRGKDCVVKFSKGNGQDLRNEIIYKRVADLLGVPCCDVYMEKYFGKDCVVSVYHYDKNKDIFMSFKSTGKQPVEIYNSLNPEEQNIFTKMVVLDYIMSQQDRHMSNIALCNGKMYPLFDNGECLGLGSIGPFSKSFRRIVKSGKILGDINKSELYKCLDNSSQVEIVRGNLESLGL